MRAEQCDFRYIKVGMSSQRNPTLWWICVTPWFPDNYPFLAQFPPEKSSNNIRLRQIQFVWWGCCLRDITTVRNFPGGNCLGEKSSTGCLWEISRVGMICRLDLSDQRRYSLLFSDFRLTADLLIHNNIHNIHNSLI